MSSSRDHATADVAQDGASGLACTKAFTDKSGNRFIYPSMIRWPQDEENDRPSRSDLILRAMSLDLAVGTKADEGWFEFDPAQFPHVRTEIGHRNFAHGGATILLFAGPEFDKAQGLLAAEPASSGEAIAARQLRDEQNPPPQDSVEL